MEYGTSNKELGMAEREGSASSNSLFAVACCLFAATGVGIGSDGGA
jgi:hypothetical protein